MIIKLIDIKNMQVDKDAILIDEKDIIEVTQ